MIFDAFILRRGMKQYNVDRTLATLCVTANEVKQSTLASLRVIARHEAIHCRPDFERASRHCEARSNPEKKL